MARYLLTGVVAFVLAQSLSAGAQQSTTPPGESEPQTEEEKKKAEEEAKKKKGKSSSSLESKPAPVRTTYGIGDMVMTSVDMPVFRAADDNSDTRYNAPRYSTFWIDSATQVGSGTEASPAWVIHFRCVTNRERRLFGCDKRTLHAGASYRKEERVTEATAYVVEQKYLELYAPRTFGFDYGLLVAPYKFHLDDRALTGEATLGGYVGYRLASPGLAVTPIVSGGVGVVSVADEQEGETDESNRASLSLATGLITTLSRNGSFQVGLLIGWDWTGDKAYKYEGEPWIAFSFGTQLTQ